MKTKNIFTNNIDTLPQGKADFLLACSNTYSPQIDTMSLTPTLDGEYIINEKIFSLEKNINSQESTSSPVLISRAVHNLHPFSSIELLDLGLCTPAQNVNFHNFDIKASSPIEEGANIDAKDIFLKGMHFGKKYELKGNYLILGESTSFEVSSAAASCMALTYVCKNDFDFSKNPNTIQAQTIRQAIRLTNQDMNNFEKLSIVSDNMLLFCAGFLLEATRRFHVVLAGGIQMAACLLIADKLREDVLMQLQSDNLSLATTQWVVHDPHSDIQHLLSLLSYKPHAIYTEFTFKNTEIALLKKYDTGEIKEGAGAGASLAYAHKNGFNNAQLLNEIEILQYCI